MEVHCPVAATEVSGCGGDKDIALLCVDTCSHTDCIGMCLVLCVCPVWSHPPAALLSFKLGDCQDSFDLVSKSLQAFPDHTDSQELLKSLKRHFTHL